MLFPRHPKPVVQQKAIATVVVRQKLDHKAMNKHVLIIPAVKPAPPSRPQQSEEN